MTTFKTPILFLVFNRPEETKRVFECIKTIRPEKLYVASDGPREKIDTDKDKNREVKDIVSAIDWNCDVKYLFREVNLGCGKAVSDAISWFFDHEEMGIILEDDCLPSISFFKFCEDLLVKYFNDERIMKICGYNFYEDQCSRINESYLFSHFGFAWGWATWKRAWNYFDIEMNLWEKAIESGATKKYPFFPERNQIFLRCREKRIDTWDYQWDFSIAINSGLAIIPTVNLIQNIGFGKDATHTTNTENERAKKRAKNIDFPLSSPPFVFPNFTYESAFFKEQKKRNNRFLRFLNRLRK